MYRIIPQLRHVSVAVSAEDMYDVTFQIKRGSNLGVLGRAGHSIQIHNGPFTRRWAYLIAESAGQAAVDALLDAQQKGLTRRLCVGFAVASQFSRSCTNYLDDLALGASYVA